MFTKPTPRDGAPLLAIDSSSVKYFVHVAVEVFLGSGDRAAMSVVQDVSEWRICSVAIFLTESSLQLFGSVNGTATMDINGPIAGPNDRPITENAPSCHDLGSPGGLPPVALNRPSWWTGRAVWRLDAWLEPIPTSTSHKRQHPRQHHSLGLSCIEIVA